MDGEEPKAWLGIWCASATAVDSIPFCRYNSPKGSRTRFVYWCVVFSLFSYGMAALFYLLCEGPCFSLKRWILRSK